MPPEEISEGSSEELEEEPSEDCESAVAALEMWWEMLLRGIEAGSVVTCTSKELPEAFVVKCFVNSEEIVSITSTRSGIKLLFKGYVLVPGHCMGGPERLEFTATYEVMPFGEAFEYSGPLGEECREVVDKVVNKLLDTVEKIIRTSAS